MDVDGPTILNPSSTVESLQASFEVMQKSWLKGFVDLQCNEGSCSHQDWHVRCLRLLESAFVEVCGFIHVLTTLMFPKAIHCISRQCFTSNKRGLRSAEYHVLPKVQQKSTSQ